MKKLSIVLMGALTTANLFAAERVDPAAEELLARALEQARAISPSEKKPGADEALRKLRDEITAKQEVWAQRLKSDAATLELLRGIPAEVLERARKIAPDRNATAQALKAGADLPLLLALVSERSPEVLSSYQNWRASVRRFGQAWYLEELVGQFNSFTRELDTKIGPQTHRPMQGVYPSTLALKGEIVNIEAEIAWVNYLQSLRKSLNETAKMYFDVQYTLHAIAIVKESRDLFKQMFESTSSQFEAGNVSQADVLKARSELANLDTRVVTLERERINSLAKINSMLALPPAVDWGAWAELDLRATDISTEEAVKLALAQSQEVLTARRETELMPLMVRMAEVEITPQAGAGFSRLSPTQGAVAGPTRSMIAAFPEKSEVSGGDAAMFSSNAAYLQELRVRVQQSKEMLELAQAKAEFAAKDATFRADRGKREQKTLSETVVPDSKQAFATLRERYSNNTAPLIEYLDAGRSYLDNALMQQGARRDYNQALIDLQDAMGRSGASLPANHR